MDLSVEDEDAALTLAVQEAHEREIDAMHAARQQQRADAAHMAGIDADSELRAEIEYAKYAAREEKLAAERAFRTGFGQVRPPEHEIRPTAKQVTQQFADQTNAQTAKGDVGGGGRTKDAPPPRRLETEHEIAEGDTLWAISKRYGVSVKDLIAMNEGVDPRRLQLKSKLRLRDDAPGAPTQTSGADDDPVTPAEAMAAKYAAKDAPSPLAQKIKDAQAKQQNRTTLGLFQELMAGAKNNPRNAETAAAMTEYLTAPLGGAATKVAAAVKHAPGAVQKISSTLKSILSREKVQPVSARHPPNADAAADMAAQPLPRGGPGLNVGTQAPAAARAPAPGLAARPPAQQAPRSGARDDLPFDEDSYIPRHLIGKQTPVRSAPRNTGARDDLPLDEADRAHRQRMLQRWR